MIMDSPTHRSLTGPQIKATRRALSMSQSDMAERIGCSRHAVSYWETQQAPMVFRRLRWGVPAQMLEVLGLTILPINRTTTHGREGGVLLDSQQAWIDRECTRTNAKVQERAARYRQPCQAKTRKGHPCRNKSEPGRRRCKFHGGMSTGPKTPEGKARIAAAQRIRWAAFRAVQVGANWGDAR
jgi:transcriptional regulator with XRE-family HTH domain